MELKIFGILLLAVVVTGRSQNYRALRLRRSEVTEKENRLPQEQCGKTVTPKILEGRFVEPGEFPWIAILGYRSQGKDPTDLSWGCLGSLITDQYVITAAHCLEEKRLVVREKGINVQYVPVTVRLGDLNHKPAVVEGEAPRYYDIQSFVVHENWSVFHQINDLGLIKLKEKVNFSDLVRPICLPPTNLQSPMFSEGDFPIVASWGITNNPTGSGKLERIAVKIANQESCRANLTSASSRWSSDLKIDDSVLCAGTKGKDACKGDGGSPLMNYYEPEEASRGRHYMIGMVSYGLGCGREGYPGVYSRVSYHMPWILEHLDI